MVSSCLEWRVFHIIVGCVIRCLFWQLITKIDEIEDKTSFEHLALKVQTENKTWFTEMTVSKSTVEIKQEVLCHIEPVVSTYNFLNSLAYLTVVTHCAKATAHMNRAIIYS